MNRHILCCPRCTRIRAQIINTPPERRVVKLSPGDYQHFTYRMCQGQPLYNGVVLGVRYEESRVDPRD